MRNLTNDIVSAYPKEKMMGINNLILRAGSLTFGCGLAAGLLLLMTNANSAVLQGVVKETLNKYRLE